MIPQILIQQVMILQILILQILILQILIPQPKFLFSSKGSTWVYKNPQFYTDFKMGLLTLYLASYQKLEPKYCLQKKITSSEEVEFFGSDL
jgi:hypothetical protein